MQECSTLVFSKHDPSSFQGKTVDATTNPLESAIALVLRAEEEGAVADLAAWLARYPAHATELADFLVSHKHLMKAVGQKRTSSELDSGFSRRLSGTDFDILEEIGRGGMGVVYRAIDRTLKRTVALKSIITGQMTTEKELIRFRFEAEAAAGLDHPSIVPVLSFGEIDGSPFLVMKLMEGGSLANRLREMGPGSQLSVNQAAQLVREVALGVHHAHQRGLLHRDLKPANILLDGDDKPHVADFGLAIVLKATFSLSQGGSLAGTAAYMAPEQVNGDQGLTTAVDVHALGAILYELITGEPPYGREEWLVTIQRVRDETPPSIHRVRTDVPSDLEEIILRCLEKDPRDRYPSALALAEDLTHFLDGEPLHARCKGLYVGVSRALARRRDTLSMSSWPAFFVTATSLVISQALVQAVILTGANPWLAYAAMASHFVGWLVLSWCFLITRAHVVSPVERMSAGLQVGLMIACLSLVPAHVYLHGNNILPIYPPMTTVFGLGVFAHGATHWGRLYLVGLYLMAVAFFMPVVPMTWWPTAHALLHGAALVWMGIRHKQFDAQARNSFSSRSGLGVGQAS